MTDVCRNSNAFSSSSTITNVSCSNGDRTGDDMVVDRLFPCGWLSSMVTFFLDLFFDVLVNSVEVGVIIAGPSVISKLVSGEVLPDPIKPVSIDVLEIANVESSKFSVTLLYFSWFASRSSNRIARPCRRCCDDIGVVVSSA